MRAGVVTGKVPGERVRTSVVVPASWTAKTAVAVAVVVEVEATVGGQRTDPRSM
jgi:hypothetical protein